MWHLPRLSMAACLAAAQTVLLLLLVHVPPAARANHNKWWTCNDACSRCVRRVTPTEEIITQLYPGLFSSTPPPSDAVPVADLVDLPLEALDATAGTNYSMGGGSGSRSATIASGAGAVNGSGSGWTGSNASEYVDSISARPLGGGTLEGAAVEGGGCCETVMEYVTPQNVTIRGKVYKVVHLRHMFQFIPIGRCKPGSRCNGGTCVDQFRAHWVLVYNNTRLQKSVAPVSFAPIEVPSHCECLNVGHATQP